MTKILYFNTVIGTFYIAQGMQGKYYPMYEDEHFDAYDNMFDAIEALAGDTSFILMHPEMGDPLDPTDLGVPDDISGWKVCEGGSV